jgi:hypothetical protein
MRSIRQDEGWRLRRSRSALWVIAGLLLGTTQARGQTVLNVTPEQGQHPLPAVVAEVRERLTAGESVELVLAPGVYRSALHLRFDEPVEGRLTLRGEGGDPIRFTAAQPLGPGWEPVNFRTWRFPLPPGMRLDPAPMLFYGDVRLEQNPNRSALDVWEIFLDHERRALVLAVPEDAELDPARMSIVYPEPEAAPLIDVAGLAAVTLDGLGVDKVPGPAAALRLSACQRVTLRGLTVAEAGGTGLALVDCDDVELLDLVVERNRKGGLRIENTDTASVGRSVFRFNTGSGLVLSSVAEARLYRVTVSDQPADGLVLAGDGAHTIRDSVLGHNAGTHIRIAGPAVTVDTARIAFGEGTGLLVETGSAELLDSILYAAGAFGLRALGATSLSVRDCIVVAGDTEPFGVIAVNGDTTYRGTGNLFFGRGEFIAFRHGKTDTDFAAWQEAVRSDLDSRVGDPAFADPEHFEFLPGFGSPWFRKTDWPVRVLEAPAPNDR